MPNFVKFLAHGSPDVKLMAGENIALLVELARDRDAETATVCVLPHPFLFHSLYGF
jgi:hypothetical protein